MTSHRSGKKRGNRSILAVLTLFFAISGALYLGEGLGVAMALIPDQPEVAESAPEPATAQCAEPPAALTAALAEKSARLSARESALDARLSALALAEQVALQHMAELRAAEESLKATIAQTDGAAEGDVAKLTAIYEVMKPVDAAAIFQAMAPDFAAGFLGRMRPEAAAAVLGGMSPEAAYGITAQIAGRNARAPTN
jgi:flagellar motility protein MotE (MotC chaperone)